MESEDDNTHTFTTESRILSQQVTNEATSTIMFFSEIARAESNSKTM